MMIKSLLKNILLSIFFLMLTSCGKKSSPSLSPTIKIEASPSSATLYFSGNIKPIRTIAVNNVSADGIVTHKGFEYGDKITKNQLLFVITSQQLSKDFQTALSEYVKSKKNYGDIKFQMNGAEQLKKLQIMSQQDYTNTKTQMFNAALDFAQAERKLFSVLHDLGVSPDTIRNMDSANPHAVNKVLSSAPDTVRKFAPAAGIALLPEENNTKDSAQNPLTLGASVKATQNLLLIGDMSGVSISIKVSELNISTLQDNQTAIITSEAFPGITLTGHIAHIDRQAANDSSSNVPAFKVTIVVPQLNAHELEHVRVGMSAQIALPLTHPAAIKLPLTAVLTEHGHTLVKKIDPATQKIYPLLVEVGSTELDAIEILHGLHPGDEVIRDATTH